MKKPVKFNPYCPYCRKHTEHEVEKVKKILADTCATRKKIPTSKDSFGQGMGNGSLPKEITVGGATIFVLGVDEATKI